MDNNFLLAFIPVFVAVDVIGLLPIFVGLTEGLDRYVKQKIVIQSLLTASCLAVGFIYLGKATFRLLGITVSDFMIAGGLILLFIAMIDLLNPSKERRFPAHELGVVPLGTPLIVGPAVLTTSLIIVDQYGVPATLFAVLANIILSGVVFIFSGAILKVIGENGARALSKVVALFLAAIAVMMIRKGVMQIIAGV